MSANTSTRQQAAMESGWKKRSGGGARAGNTPLCRRDVATYLVRILPELVTLADRARMDLSSYMLRMALQDAKEQVSKDR